MLANESEWKPWYRRKDYKGNLTEDQKRYLDSFRNGEPHPATPFGDLPDEVQSRLMELELDLKEQQDSASVVTTLVWSALGCYSVYEGYIGDFGVVSFFYYSCALICIAMGYRTYQNYSSRHEHHNWYGDTGKGEPFSSTDESLQRHWEINALSAYKRNSSDIG